MLKVDVPGVLLVQQSCFVQSLVLCSIYEIPSNGLWISNCEVGRRDLTEVEYNRISSYGSLTLKFFFVYLVHQCKQERKTCFLQITREGARKKKKKKELGERERERERRKKGGGESDLCTRWGLSP